LLSDELGLMGNAHNEFQFTMAECVLQIFGVVKGVRQGNILSLFLFKFYIRELNTIVTHMGVVCNLAGMFVTQLSCVC